jgi:hypothetical protein
MRPLLLCTVLVLAACALEPVQPAISGLAAYECGNVGCTQLGAKLTGLPPRAGLFMVAVWFPGTHDVHWAIRWAGDSVYADFASLADSSMVAAQLDDIPLTAALILSVSLLAGGRDSLTWDYRP